jgi:sec-independent protein translocase protein TatA
MMGFGMGELLIIGAVAMLIFGPRQLPRLGRSLGQSIREFRGVGRELVGDDEWKDEKDG